jgi:membrane-associated PAP2 superfamily phosphatase
VRSTTLGDFYRSGAGRRVLVYQATALAAGAIALSVGLGDGHLDLTIAQWFFDDARRVFPLTNQWWLKTVLHDAARSTSAVAALALLALTAASFIAPQGSPIRAHRGRLLFISSATLAAAAGVDALKHFSSHACPWDLELFGGVVAAPAGCSPAAHPVAGYGWLAVGFALYPIARRRAWQAWAVAFALGSLLGGVQIVRGAHFLSHVLWSAWVVSAVNVALLGALAIWRAGPASLGSARRAASCLCSLP